MNRRRYLERRSCSSRRLDLLDGRGDLSDGSIDGWCRLDGGDGSKVVEGGGDDFGDSSDDGGDDGSGSSGSGDLEGSNVLHNLESCLTVDL